MNRLIFVLCSAFAVAGVAIAQSLLPTPQSAVTSRETVRPNPDIAVVGSAFNLQVEAFAADWQIKVNPKGKSLVVKIDPKLGEEEYRLELGSSISLSAKTSTGAAWGLQTLGQLFASGVESATVSDSPDTPFRCVMIDVARRYHSPSTLRQIVRWAQLGKVRYVQLHLTDDQNWMLPSETLPGIDKLNSHGRPAYTKKELEDLQAFAVARGVTLIPEVEMPGHASLLCRHAPDTFRIKGSPSASCINFASLDVRRICKQILKETAEIFTASPYIHYGGDEAWYPEAEKDPQFQAAFAKLGAGTDSHKVFVDFVAEMAEHIVELKKTPLVWEGFPKSEFATKRIPPQTVVIAWENAYYSARDLVADGYKVINAGWDPYYVVNHYPWDAYTLVPLKRLYQHDPDVFGIVAWSDRSAASTRIGPGLWGSMMPWWEGHEWNALTTLPRRILAFGCRLWNLSGENNYFKFLARSDRWLNQLERSAKPFAIVLDGVRPQNKTQFVDTLSVSASSSDALVFAFRTDGRVPTVNDVRDSVTITTSAIVTVQAFKAEKPVGEVEFLRLQKVSVVENLAYGAKAWASVQEDHQFPASLVTDGVADDIASFWMSYPNPADLTVDLGEAVSVTRIEVVPFYAARQALEYQVFVSEKGEDWQLVADVPSNLVPPTAAGYVHRFPAQNVRYIRVRTIKSHQHPQTMARIHEVRAFAD